MNLAGLAQPAVVRQSQGSRRAQRRLQAVALHPDTEGLTRLFRSLRSNPYAPVRHQLRTLLWRVNGHPKTTSLEPVPSNALRLRRSPLLSSGEDLNRNRTC